MNVTEQEMAVLRSKGVNAGIPGIGKALEVECEICYVPAGEQCHDKLGNRVPPHVRRARAARWQLMGTDD